MLWPFCRKKSTETGATTLGTKLAWPYTEGREVLRKGYERLIAGLPPSVDTTHHWLFRNGDRFHGSLRDLLFQWQLSFPPQRGHIGYPLRQVARHHRHHQLHQRPLFS